MFRKIVREKCKCQIEIQQTNSSCSLCPRREKSSTAKRMPQTWLAQQQLYLSLILLWFTVTYLYLSSKYKLQTIWYMLGFSITRHNKKNISLLFSYMRGVTHNPHNPLIKFFSVLPTSRVGYQPIKHRNLWSIAFI